MRAGTLCYIFEINTDIPSCGSIVDIVNNSGIATVPKGTPGTTDKVETEYSNKKALTTFPGFKFKTLEESAKDTVKEFAARGWVA